MAWSALFAVAVAFGVSQEPLTRILESRMQGVITEQSGTTTGSI